jgi:hypothetical protein
MHKIEWILGTNERINSFEDACKMVKYYGNRRKIERFHYVLKSGCNVEKIQERTIDKTIALVLMYSIISVFIMNLTYIARINPDLPCDALFEEQEWKVLFCIARTKKAPDKPRSRKLSNFWGGSADQNKRRAMGRPG